MRRITRVGAVRRLRFCWFCDGAIEIGEPAYSFATVVDDARTLRDSGFRHGYVCPKCAVERNLTAGEEQPR